MCRSFIFLAEGFEEIEAITVVDVLRRAGMDSKTVSITSDRSVTGAHGITVMADMTLGDADFGDAEWLILPGGMPGATNLVSNETVCSLLKEHKGKIAAICASPGVVLAPLGLLEGRDATCYPGFEEHLTGAEYTKQGVVTDGLVTTARGLGYALDLGLEISALLVGKETAAEVKDGIQYDFV